jgi:RND family efflux transporter MFP subunit
MRTTVTIGALLCALLSPAVVAAWDGVVDWAQRTELSTATSGVVEKVLVRPGQRVGKGEILLQLEQDALRAEVARTRAAQSHTRLLYEEAQRELERTEELYARTLLADRDLNLARIAHAEADAAQQQNAAAHALAQQRLRNSQLRAPFDALVLAAPVRPGQTVVTRLQAEPQLVLAAAERMVVRFEVEAAGLEALAPGGKVSIDIDGQRYSGIVESLLLDAAGSGKPVAVEASFATPHRLLPGSRARVSLP